MERIGKKCPDTFSWFLYDCCLLLGKIYLTGFFHHCRFLDDIEVMLKWRPPVVYKYLWKYVCLLAMIGLLAASLVRMIFKRPTYTAWNQATVSHDHILCYTQEICLTIVVLSPQLSVTVFI